MVHGNLAGGVEANVTHADGVDRLAAVEFRGGEYHRPADVVLIAGASGVIDRDFVAGHGVGGCVEISHDFLWAVMGDECIVKIGIRGVNLGGVFSDIILVGDFC